MKENYSTIDKLLHRLVLNNNLLQSILYDLEKKFFKDKKDELNHNHLFITGLPRSGTTILLNLLHSSDVFGSLTYGDMPLILSPNLWKSLSNKKRSMTSIDRLHGDDIKINLNSPEAFEEIFWKFLLKNSYIKKKYLIFHELNLSHIEEFKSYIRLVLKSKNKKNYLSKNNNNILRINDLSRFFINSKFIIMFRDPLNHSFSLRNQSCNKNKKIKKRKPNIPKRTKKSLRFQLFGKFRSKFCGFSYRSYLANSWI